MDALPHEVMVMVLQLIPLHERLSSCSLVQRRWAAAAAASNNMEANITSEQQLAQLQAWLQQHGRHLTSLQLSSKCSGGTQVKLKHLPCPNLLELQLRNLMVGLAPGRQTRQHKPGVLAACTRLQRLRFDDYCTFQDPRDDLVALAANKSIRNLDVQQYGCHIDDGASLDALTQLMPQLTSLTLMQRKWLSKVPSWLDSGLLTGLQALHLDGSSSDGSSTERCQISLAQLAAVVSAAPLQRLELIKYRMQLETTSAPAAGLPSLQHLKMESCYLRSTDEDAVLLAWLQACGGFRHLHLRGVLTAKNPNLPAFSALTACSKLAYLDLLADAALPAGTIMHMFSGERLFPSLVELNVTLAEFNESDAQHLVRSCPALHTLRLHHYVTHPGLAMPAPSGRHGAGLAVLHALPLLRTLAVGDILSTATAQQLARTAGLTNLRARIVSPGVCQQLAALRQLHKITAFVGHPGSAAPRASLQGQVDMANKVCDRLYALVWKMFVRS